MKFKQGLVSSLLLLIAFTFSGCKMWDRMTGYHQTEEDFVEDDAPHPYGEAGAVVAGTASAAATAADYAVPGPWPDQGLVEDTKLTLAQKKLHHVNPQEGGFTAMLAADRIQQNELKNAYWKMTETDDPDKIDAEMANAWSSMHAEDMDLLNRSLKVDPRIFQNNQKGTQSSATKMTRLSGRKLLLNNGGH